MSHENQQEPGTTVTGARAYDPSAGPLRSTLHLVFPVELGRAFPLGDGQVALGRDPGLNGLLIDHGTVSRRHATLAWSPAHHAHVLADLGSRNGTRADGVRATAPCALVNGSLVRLGDTLLVYEQEIDDGGAAGGDEVSREAVPGDCAAVRRLRAKLARAAPDPAPILVRGETGTGKERIAREIHRLSGRSGKLLTLNAAALSPTLVESQLFGHVRGAFTGAGDAQPGLFRAAHGGTLFLDEIGDLPLELQPKLLRALQEGEVLPVGATQPVRVDVRVVAATHRDLARGIAERTFREDLYARLSVWELEVPPLRARRVDLLGWVARLHAVWVASRGGAATPLRFDVDAAEAVLGAAWPLNLRGVERLVHDLGASGATTNAAIGRARLPAWLAPPSTAPPTPASSRPVLTPPGVAAADASDATGPSGAADKPIPTREEFMRVFDELGGSVHGLARHFGRDRRQIYRWIEAHGLVEKRRRD